MDLFTVVQLADPKEVTVGTRPLREGEVPILEATAGRVMELAVEGEASDEGPPHPIEATPINVADPQEQSVDVEESESSDSAEVIKTVDALAQVGVDLKRKGPVTGSDGATSSKRKRRVIRVEESSSEDADVDGERVTGTSARVGGGDGAAPQEEVAKPPSSK